MLSTKKIQIASGQIDIVGPYIDRVMRFIALRYNYDAVKAFFPSTEALEDKEALQKKVNERNAVLYTIGMQFDITLRLIVIGFLIDALKYCLYILFTEEDKASDPSNVVEDNALRVAFDHIQQAEFALHQMHPDTPTSLSGYGLLAADTVLDEEDIEARINVNPANDGGVN